jgi:hypothetical protein
LRALVATLALSVAALAAGCSKSPCEELGEKLCKCTGEGSSDCEAQVKDQLDAVSLTQNRCERVLEACVEPAGAEFCEWLLTEDGKRSCGLAPAAE